MEAELVRKFNRMCFLLLQKRSIRIEESIPEKEADDENKDRILHSTGK